MVVVVVLVHSKKAEAADVRHWIVVEELLVIRYFEIRSRGVNAVWAPLESHVLVLGHLRLCTTPKLPPSFLENQPL